MARKTALQIAEGRSETTVIHAQDLPEMLGPELFFQEQATLAYKQAKNSFVIPGIGKLVLTKSAPREMVMRFGPKTGQTVKVPAKRRIKFRVAKAAKDAILGAKK